MFYGSFTALRGSLEPSDKKDTQDTGNTKHWDTLCALKQKDWVVTCKALKGRSFYLFIIQFLERGKYLYNSSTFLSKIDIEVCLAGKDETSVEVLQMQGLCAVVVRPLPLIWPTTCV